jgi:hypothetical protein
MFLSPTELIELTDRKRQSDQIQWLRKHGYPFEIGAKGRPKVLRRVVELRLQAGVSAAPKLRLAS